MTSSKDPSLPILTKMFALLLNITQWEFECVYASLWVEWRETTWCWSCKFGVFKSKILQCVSDSIRYWFNNSKTVFDGATENIQQNMYSFLYSLLCICSCKKTLWLEAVTLMSSQLYVLKYRIQWSTWPSQLRRLVIDPAFFTHIVACTCSPCAAFYVEKVRPLSGVLLHEKCLTTLAVSPSTANPLPQK